MITSFGNKETAALFANRQVRKFRSSIFEAARRKLLQLHRVQNVTELRIPPGNHLEKLGGNRKGQWSIRINDQWRICFVFKNGNPHDVEIVDYH